LTDDELNRLWQSFVTREDDLGLYLCKAAVTTGLRLGELIALERKDVNLADRTVTVAKTYTPGIGITTPKNRKGRTVHLSEDAVRVLRDWVEAQSAKLFKSNTQLFQNSQGGYLDQSTVTKRILYGAMENAKPPKGKRLKKGEWGI